MFSVCMYEYIYSTYMMLYKCGIKVVYTKLPDIDWHNYSRITTQLHTLTTKLNCYNTTPEKPALYWIKFVETLCMCIHIYLYVWM